MTRSSSPSQDGGSGGARTSLLEATLQSSLATMDAILHQARDSEAGGDHGAPSPLLEAGSTSSVVEDILGKIEQRAGEINKHLRDHRRRASDGAAPPNGPLHQREGGNTNARGAGAPSSSLPTVNEDVRKEVGGAPGDEEVGGAEGGRTVASRPRKLSQPFLEPLAEDTTAKPGEPPTASGRQRGMSYIAPQPGHSRKTFISRASVHPVNNAPAKDKANNAPASTTTLRRRSRLTLSQPTSQRKLSIKDNIKMVARDAFGVIDVNSDGFLQKEEVIDAITMMKEQGAMAFDMDPVDMAESMMAEVDIDGDGQIDIDEFVEMMRKGAQMKGSDKNSAAGAFTYNHRMSQLARNVLLAHQKKVENAVVGNDLWLIHPLSNMHAAWDVLVSVLILLTVLTMPLSLGWEEYNEDFFLMNLVVDFIFLLDVAKNFCTGFVDENDAVIMDAKTVRSNYMMGLFISDFASSIPLDLILKASGVTGNSAVTSTKQSVKMLKLMRLGKLFRLLRISRLFRHVKDIVVKVEERLNVRISDGFTKLMRLGIGALVLGHWIGCFNFMLVRMNDFPEDSWVVYAGLEDKPPFTQWSWAFFKALAQMIMIGFETPPFTNASCDTASEWCSIEHWITLGCLYLGAVFYSLLISSISAILQTASLASRQFEEKLMQIDDYMRSKRLPAAMREKVKDYFHLQHSNGKLYNETEILDMVTPILRREIKHFNGRDITVKVPLLSVMNNREFAEEMTTVLEPTIAFQNEIILRENTTGEDMYFITSGVVEIFLSSVKNAAYVAIGDGCFFGEVSLVLGCRRTASARTKTQCTLYRVSRAKLLAILEDFPEIQSTMQRVAESRQRRLSHYVSPATCPLRPEDEVDAEDSKTELFGVDADRIASAKEEQFEQQRRGRQSHRVADIMQRPSTPQRRKAHLGHGRVAASRH